MSNDTSFPSTLADWSQREGAWSSNIQLDEVRSWLIGSLLRWWIYKIAEMQEVSFLQNKHDTKEIKCPLYSLISETPQWMHQP